MDIKEKIKDIPSSPGVYIMKDSAGAALYVGKSSSLRKRVAGYFRAAARRLPERLRAMAEQVADISIIRTSSEAEALIYENSLIKQIRPKYNVALKDDKSYPMLKLTVREAFPRLLLVRKRSNDGSAYYGPYSDAKLLRKALAILRTLFPLRTCNRMPKAVCLNYHIKQCLGPCVGAADGSSYGNIVSELKLFLDGKKDELLNVLSKRMAEASGEERFEEAAGIMARIEALGTVKEDKVRYGASAELEELKGILGIKKPVNVIEAFDISNIMGTSAAGSMIYFFKGRPRKDEYRRFRIKMVSGIDDYAMMREVVSRRYRRLLDEKGRMPDLIVIDGGKGHLAAVTDELERLGLARLAAIGIAKEFEHVYVKDRKDPIILPRGSKALHLLERIRDEAHRFAVAYHKKLVSKKFFHK